MYIYSIKYTPNNPRHEFLGLGFSTNGFPRNSAPASQRDDLWRSWGTQPRKKWRTAASNPLQRTGTIASKTRADHMYIYIYIGRRLGVPRKPIAIYLYGSAKCWFYPVFYSVFAFPSKCSISESINVSADKLGVCPRRKMINLHLPWMAKHVCNIFPIGIAVSCMFWVFVDKYKMS